jgi:DNA-binding transcriptional MerR regulator
MSASAAAIPEKLFFKIGEVCDIAGVQAHVLRYWETEFPMLQPQKNRAGQRTYRRRDVEMALRIKELLYDEQYTIAGAKKKLAGELRSPGRENGQATPAKPLGRSLKPPPSLAGRVSQPASPAPQVDRPLPTATDDQRSTLIQIAKRAREILDLMDEGDAEFAANKKSRR